ncbi:MAG: SMP-30/gluconolactonase/LRE family protein [Puniceicoccaceae bacterium]
MKFSIILSLFAAFASIGISGCGRYESKAPPLPKWTFSTDQLFTADGALLRPEDGVILPDGRLVVADQLFGLRVVEADGSTRPYGNMKDAGYLHNPPAVEAGANGVTMDPTGSYLLVADMYQCGIYKVDIATETAELFYQHKFGVNVARADSHGGVWFSQSTRNTPEENSAGLWEHVDVAVPDGALLYIAPEADPAARKAVLLAEGLEFANGIALDEKNGIIYHAESLGGRVWKYDVDFNAGTVSERTLAFDVNIPDNLELDEHGRLWIACPLHMEIVVADPATGSVQSVFRISSQESERAVAQVLERINNREPWLDLAGPALWGPSDSMLTGLVLDPDNKTVYATGLGSLLIKLEY